MEWNGFGGELKVQSRERMTEGYPQGQIIFRNQQEVPISIPEHQEVFVRDARFCPFPFHHIFGYRPPNLDPKVDVKTWERDLPTGI